MLSSTTDTLQGYRITEYLGICNGEAISGTNLFRDFFAGIKDKLGGRVGGYQNAFAECTRSAFADAVAMAERQGADALLGVRFQPVTMVGNDRTILGVTVTATAVRVQKI